MSRKSRPLDFLLFFGDDAPFVYSDIGSSYEFHFAALAYRAFGVVSNDCLTIRGLRSMVICSISARVDTTLT